MPKNFVKKNKVTISNDSNSGIRIQKLLAQIGVGSRREIEKAIIEKRISVNNKLAEIGQSVSDADRIVFDGKLINLNFDKALPRILIYNKPEGEIVSESDPKGRAPRAPQASSSDAKNEQIQQTDTVQKQGPENGWKIDENGNPPDLKKCVFEYDLGNKIK